VINGSLIVTGSESGLGMAVAEAFAPMFAVNRVLRMDVRGQPAIDVRDHRAVRTALDLAIEPRSMNYLFHSAWAAFFTSPANGEPVDFIGAPIDQLRAMVDINVMGTINVLHSFIGSLVERHARGNIVVVSSVSSFHSGGPNMAVYDATKAAITALVKRLVPYKHIRANIISPGSVRTGIGGFHPDMRPDPDGARLVKSGQDGDARRLGTEVTVEHIVRLARTLFFEETGMSGADIVVDEGLTLMGREGYGD